MIKWFARFFRNNQETKSSTLELFREIFGYPISASGRSVNWTTAVQCSVALACARVLSEGIAQLPFRLRRKTAEGSVEVVDHPIVRLIERGPNAWSTWFEFVETLTFNAVLGHGGYAIISRSSDGRVLELLPVPASVVRVERSSDWSLSYEFTLSYGTSQARTIKLPKQNVLHVRGPSLDGFVGLDGIRVAQEAIGLALATEEAHARLHNNSVMPSGIYSVDGTLTKEQYERLAAFIESHFTKEKRFRPMILDRSAKWQPLAMTGVDAQHLETRRFQVEEVCRAFRVLPIMVGHADKTATYASAEQMFIAHVVHSLMPWVRRWESVMNRDLLTEEEFSAGYYFDVSTQALLRGDAKTRADYFTKAIASGWMTRNEVREAEELNRLEGLDLPLTPLNMVSVSDESRNETQAE